MKKSNDKRFLVIGPNGAQGKIVARDLATSGYRVILGGLTSDGLEDLLCLPRVTFEPLDLIHTSASTETIVEANPDVVVNCAIDDYNLLVTQAAHSARAHYVDLGSEEQMTKAQFDLDADFKTINRTAITGMGSTPGITNVMLRHVRPEFDAISTVHLGFAWDCNQDTFVAPFSMDAIAWEFTHPAKLLEDGVWVEKRPAECTLDYDYINMEKRRTYYTPHIEHFTFYEYLRNMGVKNIAVCSSFPKHSHAMIENLIAMGLLSKTPRDYHGQNVSPCELTTDILRDIPTPEGYREWENLWLYVEGVKEGKPYATRLDCYVETMKNWEFAGCNIDTGWPVSITAQMLANGEIPLAGVFAPESVMPTRHFLGRLEERNFRFFRDGKVYSYLDSSVNTESTERYAVY